MEIESNDDYEFEDENDDSDENSEEEEDADEEDDEDDDEDSCSSSSDDDDKESTVKMEIGEGFFVNRISKNENFKLLKTLICFSHNGSDLEIGPGGSYRCVVTNYFNGRKRIVTTINENGKETVEVTENGQLVSKKVKQEGKPI